MSYPTVSAGIAFAFSLAGCAAQSTDSQLVPVVAGSQHESKGDRRAVPANYRKLVARNLLESSYGPNIRRGNISQPFEQWTGLIRGGTRPVVCVELFRETVLFPEARDIWFFSFQDNQVEDAWIGGGYATCPNVSPLQELSRKS
jgi:hypothetical protein